ncbi:hypothetical protein BCR37DRAFT_392087 [Protomyces lactucae-debilis]|uniref:Cytochrome P450 n=1 Tax=Protomyces lactucae-debilis TaxID=2754530 RepID=A0A1Y2FJ30_PROLT|nr:uncharacterized protein BCR37DRAFT_392087 [Protomyces lactucae-debilis]ORY83607.1 hypothetical protein BCR37DRAFT_392087 [Protomyces lactucae-debilis]
MSSEHDYSLSTKILAGILSPWFAFTLVFGVLCFFYIVVWKPRLHHAYPSWPKSPGIYLSLPYKRRKAFKNDPIGELNRIRNHLPAPVFWTDIVPAYKTLTIVNSDALIVQFLSSEHKEELSWDAATRYAWNHLFKEDSPFGRSASFNEACRLCLAAGFSKTRTTMSSALNRMILNSLASLMEPFGNGNLHDIVDRIVSTALLTIFIGDTPASLAQPYDELCRRLRDDRQDSKAEARLAEQLRTELDHAVQSRLADPELSANDDYLGFILSDQSRAQGMSPLPSHATLQEAAPGAPSVESSSDNAEQLDAFTKTNAVKNLPDHLLSALLQTRMLVTTCIFWKLYSAATQHSTVGPDPLLLVRQATEETLLGSTVIPKDAFVAICTAGELQEPSDRDTGSHGRLSRNQSSTELASLPTAYSSGNLSDLTTNDTLTLPNSASFSSFSPLLRGPGDRRGSQSSSFNAKGEPERQNLLASYRSRQGTWQRHYPQGHLISLMVGSISNALSQQLIITGSGEVKAIYNGASSLFLPQPSLAVAVIKGTSPVLQAPVSFYSASRSNSTYLVPDKSAIIRETAE